MNRRFNREARRLGLYGLPRVPLNQFSERLWYLMIHHNTRRHRWECRKHGFNPDGTSIKPEVTSAHDSV